MDSSSFHFLLSIFLVRDALSDSPYHFGGPLNPASIFSLSIRAETQPLMELVKPAGWIEMILSAMLLMRNAYSNESSRNDCNYRHVIYECRVLLSFWL